MQAQKVRFLGSGREVGRSAILVDAGERYVFDYGVNVQTMEIPIAPPPDTRCVFLSHAHLDHSGALPTLYACGYECRTYMTQTTQRLSEMLLNDSLKVQRLRGGDPGFSAEDIVKTLQHSQAVPFDRPFNVGHAVATFHDAGHVPGSASVLLEACGKRMLYTGDINFMDTALMRSAYKDFEDIDVLITECTYSYKNHPDRSKLAEELRKRVKATVDGGGIALLPAFAVGRAQETLLSVTPSGVPVLMDGMGIDATRIVIHLAENLASAKRLSNDFEKAKKIRRQSQRSSAVEKPAAIITTSGMLQGGPVGFYIDRLHARRDCSLTLLGYQVEGLPGRTLMDTGRYVTDAIDVKPEMDVRFMDFSSHASRDDLLYFIRKLSPQKILLFHGERATEFAAELKGMGFDAAAPANGDSVPI